VTSSAVVAGASTGIKAILDKLGLTEARVPDGVPHVIEATVLELSAGG
jgi:hypothetical protein